MTKGVVRLPRNWLWRLVTAVLMLTWLGISVALGLAVVVFYRAGDMEAAAAWALCFVLVALPCRYDPAIQLKERNERRAGRW